ncbi:hypothetical protein CR513_36824, partial [Mucuna pruriens]
MATICLLLAMATIRHWPLHQLDIKNAFLHGDLDEEIYMEQPPGFVAQGESGLVCKLRRSLYRLKQSPRAWFGKFRQVVQNFGMTRSEVDHFIFYCHSYFGKCVYLVVYVDDIVIIGNDDIKVSQLNHFQTKDLGHLKYFLGIEVAQSKEGIVISQRKYAFDILQETSMSNCRLVDSPIDPNMKLMVKQGELYFDPKRYRRLVGKLIYLTITRPDMSFAVGAPCIDHWAAVLRILRYIKKTPGEGLLYEDKGDTYISGYCDVDWVGSPIGFCISIRGNVASLKSKKQNTVARSSVEAEYQAMTSATCELIWVKQLIQELKFVDVQPMKLYCDNQVALHIASNPVFHEITKHIEIDCHFVQKKLLAKEIRDHRYKLYVPSLEHIIYMLQLEGEMGTNLVLINLFKALNFHKDFFQPFLYLPSLEYTISRHSHQTQLVTSLITLRSWSCLEALARIFLNRNPLDNFRTGEEDNFARMIKFCDYFIGVEVKGDSDFLTPIVNDSEDEGKKVEAVPKSHLLHHMGYGRRFIIISTKICMQKFGIFKLNSAIKKSD